MAIVFKNATTNLNVTTAAIANKPGSTSDGDIIILGITCVGDATITTPAGFTALNATATGATVGDNRLNTYWKIAAGEGADWTASLSISEYWATFAISFSGSDPTNPIDVSAIGVGSATAVTCPSITTTQANDIRVAIASNYGLGMTSWNYPVGFTGDGFTTGWYANIAGAHVIQAAAGASGTAVYTASATAENYCAVQIAIKETAAAGGSPLVFTLSMLGVGA